MTHLRQHNKTWHIWENNTTLCWHGQRQPLHTKLTHTPHTLDIIDPHNQPNICQTCLTALHPTPKTRIAQARYQQLIDLITQNPHSTPQQISQTIYGTPNRHKLVTKLKIKAIQQQKLPPPQDPDNTFKQAITHHLTQQYPQHNIQLHTEPNNDYLTPPTQWITIDTHLAIYITNTTLTIEHQPNWNEQWTRPKRNPPRKQTIDLSHPHSITQLEQILQRHLRSLKSEPPKT